MEFSDPTAAGGSLQDCLARRISKSSLHVRADIIQYPRLADKAGVKTLITQPIAQLTTIPSVRVPCMGRQEIAQSSGSAAQCFAFAGKRPNGISAIVALRCNYLAKAESGSRSPLDCVSHNMLSKWYITRRMKPYLRVLT